MRIILKCLLLFSFLTLTSFSVHKYYFSITKVEIDESSKLLKIYSQVFIDDFEKLLTERYQISVADFSNLKENEHKIIAKYVTAKLKLKVNRSPIALKLLGCDIKNDLLYVFIEGNYTKPLKRLDIENSLLQDLFTEQQNKVDVTFNKVIKSLHLNSQKKQGTLFY